MKTTARRKIEDHGCPLKSHAGDSAPEYEDEYRLGAWMAAPVGATGRHTVCDPCVRKIRNGSLTYYRLNEVTLEVTENPRG